MGLWIGNEMTLLVGVAGSCQAARFALTIVASVTSLRTISTGRACVVSCSSVHKFNESAELEESVSRL
jgi:hypothetical protein